MTSRELTSVERELVGRCLYEAANGAYFPDWEFETLMGRDRFTVRKTASRWLSGERISDESKALTISTLNNLFGYPHNRLSELEAALGVTVPDIKRVFEILTGEILDG